MNLLEILAEPINLNKLESAVSSSIVSPSPFRLPNTFCLISSTATNDDRTVSKYSCGTFIGVFYPNEKENLT